MPRKVLIRKRKETLPTIYCVDPIEEPSSWLDDSLCAICNTPTQSLQLYCSQECKEHDEGPSLRSKSQLFDPLSVDDDYNRRLRYPWPSLHRVALTDPAIKALEDDIQLLNSTSMRREDIESFSSDSSSSASESNASEDHSRSTLRLQSLSHQREEKNSSNTSSPRPSYLTASSLPHFPSRQIRSVTVRSFSQTTQSTLYSPVVVPSSHLALIPDKTSSFKSEHLKPSIEYARRPSTTNLTSPGISSWLSQGSNRTTSARRSSEESSKARHYTNAFQRATFPFHEAFLSSQLGLASTQVQLDKEGDKRAALEQDTIVVSRGRSRERGKHSSFHRSPSPVRLLYSVKVSSMK